MAPLVRRTWAPCGKTPFLKQRTRSHEKVSAIAAISLSPRYRKSSLFFRLRPQSSIRAPHVRDFLRHLLRQIKGVIVIVWDRGRTHQAKKVMSMVLEHKRLYFVNFPPYAPELNPVEYLWSYLKSVPLANRPELTIDSLKKSAFRSSRSIQHKPHLLQSFVKHSSLFL